MNRREFLRATGMLGGAFVAGNLAMSKGRSPGASALGSRPNILLIMTDQQSADAMSCRMGIQYVDTPAIDSLAAAGVSFTRAYTANPLCVPARTSIFTGQYPHVTGVQTNSDITKPVADRFRSLGKYFSDAGYDTGYVGKWHLPFPVEKSSVHGFHSMGRIRNNGVDDEIPPFAKEFLLRKREAPFFLVTSFVNPHNICEWARGEELKDGAIGEPPPVEQCPPPVDNPDPAKGETDIMLLMRRSFQANRLFPVGEFDEKKWREYRWAYFRMIEKVDGYIGEILGALRASGQAERTVIVFTSDHGDMQGAHGWNQKTVFYDNSSRVPLIISAPGSRTPGTSNRLVNTGIDLLPTLCDSAGIPVPAGLPGMSLLSHVHRPNAPDPRPYIVISNKMIQGSSVDGRKPEPAGRMVRSQRYKYCVFDEGTRRESLVDMEHDPLEMTNLVGDSSQEAVLNQHRRYLADWEGVTGDTFRTVSGNTHH